MLIAGFPAGPWGTNCFLVATGPGAECVIIDPGKDASPGIADSVREHGLKPVAVVLTHGHIDHMWSVVPVAEGYGVPAWIHPGDRTMLADPVSGISADARAALAGMTGGLLEFREPDDVRELVNGSTLELAGLTLLVDHAPGHTQGSVAFRLPAAGDLPQVMLSGDLLFAGSIGRTDLPGGDHAAMLRSLARVVLPLDDDTVVLPGHGEQTTIGRERVTNPFLQDLPDGSVGPEPVTRGL